MRHSPKIGDLLTTFRPALAPLPVLERIRISVNDSSSLVMAPPRPPRIVDVKVIHYNNGAVNMLVTDADGDVIPVISLRGNEIELVDGTRERVMVRERTEIGYFNPIREWGAP